MRKNAQREQLEHIVCSNKKDGCNEKHFKCKGPEVWTCIKIMEIGTNQYVTLYMGILREVTAHTTVPLCGLFLGFLKTTHRTKLS